MEKTVKFYRLSAIYKDAFYNNWVTIKSQKDVLVQSVQINNCNYMKRRRKKENSYLYKDCKLFLSKDEFEVVRVDCDVASILSFWVNVLLPSKSIWFGTKMARIESNDKIELREVFGLLYLSLGQYLGSKKILKVFIIYNNIDRIDQTL